MHCVLICPFTQGPTRGNITSVRRIARYLQQAGCQVDLLPLDTPDWATQLQQATVTPPDLLHAFHAYHAGPVARQTAQALGIPYVITLTGSDLFDPSLRDHPHTLLAIADAAAVTCFDPLVAELAAQSFPQAADKLVVIPQGVEPFPASPPAPRPENAFIVLLPAALRPVKGIDFALEQLAPLAAENPSLQLWVVGGVLDREYAELIRAQAASLAWVTLLGEVPHPAMGRLYATADLILNSSLFEGGMANALLEAMVMAKPVLARDVPGNRSLVRHGETGWLFTDGVALRQLVRSCMEQPDQANGIGRAARQYVSGHFAPTDEATALLNLYHKMSHPHLSRAS